MQILEILPLLVVDLHQMQLYFPEPISKQELDPENEIPVY